MPFFDLNERNTRELFPGAITRTCWGDNVLLSLVDLDPHSVVPDHDHPHEQAGYVLEGEIEVTIGGESRRMGPGEVFVVPGGVTHRVTVGDTAARVLDIFSPVREEYKY